MASSTPEDPLKPVTGHPSDEPSVATGFPSIPWSSLPPSDSYFYMPAPPPSPHFPPRLRPLKPYHKLSPECSALILIPAVILVPYLVLAGFVLAFHALTLLIGPLPPYFSVGSAFFPPIWIPPENGAFWNLSMHVTNPNSKLDILYDRLQTSVLYKEKFLTARTDLPPIEQGKGNQTFLMNARLQNVGVLDVMRGEGERNGVVSYGVKVWGTVRFRRSGGGGWRSPKRLITVFCDGVEIGYDGSGGGAGRLLNPGKECNVDI